MIVGVMGIFIVIFHGEDHGGDDYCDFVENDIDV